MAWHTRDGLAHRHGVATRKRWRGLRDMWVGEFRINTGSILWRKHWISLYIHHKIIFCAVKPCRMSSRSGNDFDASMLSSSYLQNDVVGTFVASSESQRLRSEDVAHDATDWLFAFVSEEYDGSRKCNPRINSWQGLNVNSFPSGFFVLTILSVRSLTHARIELDILSCVR